MPSPIGVGFGVGLIEMATERDLTELWEKADIFASMEPFRQDGLPANYQDSPAAVDARKVFNDIKALLADLKQCDLKHVPSILIRNQAIGPIDSAMSYLSQIDAAAQKRDPILNELSQPVYPLQNLWDSTIYSSISNLILLASRPSQLQKCVEKISLLADKLRKDAEGSDSLRDEMLKDFDRAMTSFRTRSEEEFAEFKKLVDESNQIRTDLKKAIGEIGASTHAVRFRNESMYQLCESVLWLIIAVAIGIFLFKQTPVDVDLVKALTNKTADMWPRIVLRVAILAIPTVFMFIALRNFSACKHNCIVNKHRQNALSTFQLFSDAALDDETKSTILLEATRAVFGQTQTGYLKAANEANPITQIVELIKPISKDSS